MEPEQEQESQAGELRGSSPREVEAEGGGAVERDATAAAETAEARADETVPEAEESGSALLGDNERDDAARRWRDIQARFVDDPRSSVEEANALVADLMDRLVSGFGTERSRLEAQWDRGEEVTTEELRVVLQRYRSFFSRLLEVQEEAKERG